MKMCQGRLIPAGAMLQIIISQTADFLLVFRDAVSTSVQFMRPSCFFSWLLLPSLAPHYLLPAKFYTPKTNYIRNNLKRNWLMTISNTHYIDPKIFSSHWKSLSLAQEILWFPPNVSFVWSLSRRDFFYPWLDTSLHIKANFYNLCLNFRNYYFQQMPQELFQAILWIDAFLFLRQFELANLINLIMTTLQHFLHSQLSFSVWVLPVLQYHRVNCWLFKLAHHSLRT